MISAKKERKTIEWERLEISLRKLEIQREHFMQRWAQYRTERVWTQQKQKLLRRGGKNNTEELYKKDLHDPDNNDGEITRLEPDILECRVKWALGSITTKKASGDDEIPAELFLTLKDDSVKVLHSIWQQIGKLSSGHRTGKCQFSFQSQRKAMPKNA